MRGVLFYVSKASVSIYKHLSQTKVLSEGRNLATFWFEYWLRRGCVAIATSFRNLFLIIVSVDGDTLVIFKTRYLLIDQVANEMDKAQTFSLVN